jgi:L-cysteine desulfidase
MDSDLKLLVEFDNKIEAEIVKSLLESNGINVFLSTDDAYGYYPSFDLERKIKLFVLKKDFDEAKDIISKGYEKEG